MARGSVGMAVDQRGHPGGAHFPLDLGLGDIGDVHGLGPGLLATFAAQLARQLLAAGQRQVAQDEEGEGVAQDAAQLLVALVAGAEGIAVHQQHATAVEVGDMAIRQQAAGSLAAKGLADEKVAIAVHQVDGRAAVSQLAQGRGNLLLEGTHGVVADPGFEQIAKDVQGLGTAGAGFEEMQKRPDQVRALRFEMQVGDQ